MPSLRATSPVPPTPRRRGPVLRRLLAAGVPLVCAVGLTAAPASAERQSPLTRDELRSAWVPSLCGHPSGQLVDGTLPGIPENQGEVSMTDLIAFGKVRPHHGPGAAAVVRCNIGGVGWPDHVLFYEADGDGRPAYVAEVELAQITDFGREFARAIKVRHKAAVVRWYSGEADKCMACGTVDASAKLRPRDNGTVQVVSKQIYTSTSFLRKRLLPQVNRHHKAGVRKVASKHAARNLLSAGHDYGKLHVLSCYTPGDYTGAPQPSRYCDVAGPRGWLHLSLDHLGWHRWKVTHAALNSE